MVFRLGQAMASSVGQSTGRRKVADDLLAEWHRYRIPALLLVAVLALSCFIQSLLVRRNRGQRRRLSIPPPVRAPDWKATSRLQETGGEVPDGGRGNEGHDKPHPPEKSNVVVVERAKLAPKRVTGSKAGRRPQHQKPNGGIMHPEPLNIQPIVFFSSLTGTTELYAKNLVHDLQASVTKPSPILDPQLHDLSYIDYDDYFVSPPQSPHLGPAIRHFYLLLLPTYNIDTILDNFLLHLQETHHDFRIDTAPLSRLAGYSVFGFGDKEGWPTEDDGFCSQAKTVDKWMAKLTNRKRAFPLGMGDVKSDAATRLKEWRLGVQDVLQHVASGEGLGEGVVGSGDAVESDEEDDEADEADEAEDENSPAPIGRPPRETTNGTVSRKGRKGPVVDDLEDLGRQPVRQNTPTTSSTPLPIDFTTPSSSPALPLMVPRSSPTYAALTKQGYSIIGSHSGVKICRWTKSALRGRGSCYKYSFYGIASHLCMEATPSLSCSNKCVFCWRHGTNPVGTTWRWALDPPELIFAGAKAAHLQKIKMLRGVPGVRADRFQEAMRIRHCALSLVGEPIFYPAINALVGMLHAERISTFLVCNAQHPGELAALGRVTQLYVSVDAANRESLRRIDRPLFRDFWERLLACLDILRGKGRGWRTVFRLTLVKGFNVEGEVEGYADLVGRGRPGFVEVKGVTYCGTVAGTGAGKGKGEGEGGTKKGAGLTMGNVPFWEEVVEFAGRLVGALERRGLDYGVAAEHGHSCCVLVADRTRFCRGGRWRTLIDFERFFELVEREKRGEGGFEAEDYVGGDTPVWAGEGRGGFDPRDERVWRRGGKAKGKGKGTIEMGGGGGGTGDGTGTGTGDGDGGGDGGATIVEGDGCGG